MALLCRLSQPTTSTGSSWAAAQPSPSLAIGDAPPSASDDTAREDGSPVLASGSGAIVEPAAVTANLPESGAVSEDTDVQGIDDQRDDSEGR